MAEASENLQAVMARHPEIKKLAEQKEAMRQALISKGIDADNVTDFERYADILKTFNFSIDSTIESNGYTYNVGTDEEPVTLSSMMAKDLKYNAILKDKTAYTANDFKGDTSITYLNVKPMSGSLAGFCNGATGLKYVPQLDFSEVTNLTYAFYGTTRLFVHDEYTVDLAKCGTMNYSQWWFAKKLILKNMSSTCSCEQLFYTNTVVESAVGLNVSYASARINVLFVGANNLTHVEFSDDCVIRCANVLSNEYKEPTTTTTLFDKFDAETLYAMCTHAYDWTTNPRGYAKIAGAQSNDGYCTNYYNYHFSDTAKAKLEAAYPEVDFTTLMEDKGWQY